MKLRWGVGIAIVIFAVLLLFFWARGFWFPAPAPTPLEQGQASQKAAQQGLFDQPSPPIVH